MATRIIDQTSREAGEAFWCVFEKLMTPLRWLTSRSRSVSPACQGKSLKDLLTQRARDSCASEKLYGARERTCAAAPDKRVQ